MRKILCYILVFVLLCFVIPIIFTKKYEEHNLAEVAGQNDLKEKQENNTIIHFLKNIVMLMSVHKNIAENSQFVHLAFRFNLCLSVIICTRFYETLFQIPQSPYVLLISLLLAAMWLSSHSFFLAWFNFIHPADVLKRRLPRSDCCESLRGICIL